MMREAVRRRLAGESGFTLLEVLVITVIIAILAALAIALLLNQREKANDSNAKSNVTNLAREMQICRGDQDEDGDYHNCDSDSELGKIGLPLSSDAPSDAGSAECDGNPSTATISGGGTLRVVQTGKDCFTVLATSSSGNRFWYIKHRDGSVARGCLTPGSSGCPPGAVWGG